LWQLYDHIWLAAVCNSEKEKTFPEEQSLSSRKKTQTIPPKTPRRHPLPKSNKERH